MTLEKGVNGWKALGFKSYSDYIHSNLWKEKRDWIIESKKKCERCGSTVALNVHHLNYDNVGNEKQEDVIVLCWECHHKEHYGIA